MAKSVAKQLPLKLRSGHKTDVRAQFAALCWRMKNDKLQICLITSRTRKRWIIPKGWPMHKQTPANTAATEAFEEAGLSGRSRLISVSGSSATVKPQEVGNAPVVTMVYPLQVTQCAQDWPEKQPTPPQVVQPAKGRQKSQ